MRVVPGGHELVPRRNVLDMPEIPSGEEGSILLILVGSMQSGSEGIALGMYLIFGYQFIFQSVPGQEDLSRWFEEKMSNPEALHEEFRNRDTKLRTLIHGDLWHNNIFFKVRSAQFERISTY